MVNACDDIVRFTDGLRYEQFEENMLVRFAVRRQLLVVGEAAAHLSEEVRASYDEIPWRSMIGLRNILAHDYGDILTQRVWTVATRRIPELKANLEKILQYLDDDGMPREDDEPDAAVRARRRVKRRP